MMKIKYILTFVGLNLLTSCATQHVIENEKNQTQVLQATSDASQQVELLKQQAQLQRQILKQAAKTPPPRWSQFQKEAEQKVANSQIEWQQLRLKFEALRDGSGAFSAYAHSHPRVLSQDPGWPQAEEWRRNLQLLTQAWNQQLKVTSDAINQAHHFMAENGLFKKKSTLDLAQKLQAHTENWRLDYRSLSERFEGAQKQALNSEAHQHLQSLQKKMAELLGLITAVDDLKSQYLSELSGRSEVTNLDPEWARLEYYNTRMSQLETRWSNTHEKTNGVLDLFNRSLVSSSGSF